VVGAGSDSSFVIADIPGIIEGAAEGAGLGAQFLRHLSRTRILIHLVDAAPMDGTDPLGNAQIVASEVLEYSEALAERPIWLVLNKLDLLDEGARAELLSEFQEAFPDETIYAISAATGAGLDLLVAALQREIAEMRERLASDEEYAQAQAELEARINEDVLASALSVRPQRTPQAEDADDLSIDDEGPDDDEPEVVYVHE
jgi:GTP-binding protein